MQLSHRFIVNHSWTTSLLDFNGNLHIPVGKECNVPTRALAKSHHRQSIFLAFSAFLKTTRRLLSYIWWVYGLGEGSLMDQSVNQSINFYSTNIPGKVRLSSTTAESVSNGKALRALPRRQQAIRHAGVHGGKAKSKRCVFTQFLEVAVETAERTDSEMLLHREGKDHRNERPLLRFNSQNCGKSFTWDHILNWKRRNIAKLCLLLLTLGKP